MTRFSDKRNTFKFAAAIAAAILLIASVILTYGRAIGLGVPGYGDVFRLFGLSPQSELKGSYLEVASVGNADCIIIYSDGHAAIIDSGDNSDSGHAVEKYLLAEGIRKLDYAFVTHYHDDHIGGLPTVLGSFDVERIVMPPGTEQSDAEDPAVSELRKAIGGSAVEAMTMTAGDVFNVGGFTLSVLCIYDDEPDENDRSAVIMAECGGRRFLLTGDAGNAAEARLIDSGADIKADVLKVGHHGSSTATSERFLKSVSPDTAVISCGTTRAGTPANGVIERLKRFSINVIRTDISGNVKFIIESGGIRVETGR